MRIKTPAQLDADLSELIQGMSPVEMLKMAAKLEADAATIRQQIFATSKNKIHQN